MSEIPMTDAMREAMVRHPIARHVMDDGILISFYRAMAAIAPSDPKLSRLAALEDNLLGEQKLQRLLCERDQLIVSLTAERDNALLVAQHNLEALQALQRQFSAAEPGDHPYHGPTETVPHPTDPDRTVRRPVPDPVHERFHGAVGDVIAGRVLPEARRQMQEALKGAPKEAPSFPANARVGDPRRMGLA